MQPIQMNWSQIQKNFSEVLSAFPKFTKNSEYFEKENEPQRPLLSEIKNFKKWCDLTA